MCISRKRGFGFLFVAAMALGGCMPTHNRLSDSHVMDEARARQILATVPQFDMSQVWFATGGEYWNSATCLAGRDIFAFTRPEPSSPGIWRGKKLFIRQPVPGVHPDCADPDAFSQDPSASVDTVSFTDPGQLHPEEDEGGLEPGISEVRGGISDEELRRLALGIAQLRSCVSERKGCGFPVDLDKRVQGKETQLGREISTGNMLFLAVRDDDAGRCYDMILTSRAWGGFELGICYRGDSIVSAYAGGAPLE